MKHDIGESHPIRAFFADAVHRSLSDRLGMRHMEDVELYLADMLVDFMHRDEIFAIKDSAGRRLEAVTEMIVEGDVRLNADSFDREREVHRHIGDFLLFWSGLFPEFLNRMIGPGGKDAMLDAVAQGRLSYEIVGSFDHDPYGAEAPTFRKMSAEFEGLRIGLGLVRASFDGFARQGWADGFRA